MCLASMELDLHVLLEHISTYTEMHSYIEAHTFRQAKNDVHLHAFTYDL